MRRVRGRQCDMLQLHFAQGMYTGMHARWRGVSFTFIQAFVHRFHRNGRIIIMAEQQVKRSSEQLGNLAARSHDDFFIHLQGRLIADHSAYRRHRDRSLVTCVCRRRLTCCCDSPLFSATLLYSPCWFVIDPVEELVRAPKVGLEVICIICLKQHAEAPSRSSSHHLPLWTTRAYTSPCCATPL